MNPDTARLRAVDALADELDRTHADARADAERFITALQRKGWRWVPEVVDLPAQARTAPRHVAEAAIAEIRDVLADARRRHSDGGAR